MRAVGIICCCLLLVACGGGGAGGASVHAAPKSLPYTGGNISISAEATTLGLNIVRSGPDGSETIAMQDNGDGSFSLDLTIPANTADDGQAAEHLLDLRDADDTLLGSITVSVEAMDAPPSPPVFE